MGGWMDCDFTTFQQQLSHISEQWWSDYGRLCEMEPRLRLKVFPYPEIKLGGQNDKGEMQTTTQHTKCPTRTMFNPVLRNCTCIQQRQKP